MLWADGHIAREPSLNHFGGAQRGDLIAEFARTDTALRRASTLAAIDGAAQGQLRKALGSRHMALVRVECRAPYAQGRIYPRYPSCCESL